VGRRDEAGQALPQMACGALWRAKRAVIVGDPLQIEPVNASPPLLSYHLSESFGLESSDLAGGASVQVLADRLNKYGTELKNKNNSIWVGSPLRVHRRCINPMFQIANEISYNGSMVCSTIERNSNLLMQTGFLDIKGNVRDGQYIEEQGLAVLKLVQAEFDNNSDIGITPSLYIISPFNIVAKNIKQLLIKLLVSNKFDKDSIYDWVHDSVGTVHTFQGKEADGVIMCLGCDKTKVGAARWAASSPNILNVALTRAKYRFIAIGDKDIWLKQKYFSELSQLN